nr:MAG TPA: hypothetical protein [Caudoviricetes sp.]
MPVWYSLQYPGEAETPFLGLLECFNLIRSMNRRYRRLSIPPKTHTVN